ncbi:GNAT family N-acetyltransferase [Mucilaginibacter rubeus]|uniref:GNAT family N-acetyltransferase n=1 Tax=Mucilaginibacter rubeus TaxID=2027860 RepID=A0A5C1HUQ6_9SPHI|nr:GNAT family N-acetyltransferase [Mucilaginibacter rubeus]QEM09173.1 GNAT family N-acetyltransferase [Mucilaginibacter rubeus]
MIAATKSDRNDIVSMLTEAFADNKSVNYIIADPGDRKQIKALMGYSFDVCEMFGKVFITEDRRGCALLLYPQEKRPTLRGFWLDIKLIFQAVGILNIGKALNRESAIKRLQPGGAMVYLWFIGVSPESQHHGVGSKLMQEIIQMADDQNLPVLLETSVPENIGWYSRFGFKTYAELDLSYTLYFLRR